MEIEGNKYKDDEYMEDEKPGSLWKIGVVALIACGVQFGWALQLSLLTPYTQHLGIPHMWSSFVWLCGPISGLVVQPLVGYSSDHSTNRFGRRKPYILSGTVLICLSVLLISFALDFGKKFGDSMARTTKPRAVTIFVVGFWILDVANNVVQGPTRAFLADLSRNNHRRMRVANAFFSFFMAVGNILGYAAGSYDHLYRLLPFTKTGACDLYCANLKTCFFIDIFILLLITTIALLSVTEPPPVYDFAQEEPVVKQVKDAFRTLGRPMWILFLVTALNWLAWFPFLLFNTDWVGREVYGGNVNGDPREKALYDTGVRRGSLGLMLTAGVLGFMSLAIDPLSKVLKGARKLWGIVNIVLAVMLALTAVVTKQAEQARRANPHMSHPPPNVEAATFTLFAVMGIPQAVTFSVPFALASIFSASSGAGQGLSLGVLNLAIVTPQLFVSLISGPWDALFGGGNLPAFLLGSVAALASGVLALTVLPSPSSGT
ncbi:hypothetical protein V2J09_002437 [Rumex salicifolius]